MGFKFLTNHFGISSLKFWFLIPTENTRSEIRCNPGEVGRLLTSLLEACVAWGNDIPFLSVCHFVGFAVPVSSNI